MSTGSGFHVDPMLLNQHLEVRNNTGTKNWQTQYDRHNIKIVLIPTPYPAHCSEERGTGHTLILKTKSPRVSLEPEQVVQWIEQLSSSATDKNKMVDEKFGEQNFRVLSEMRILAKIRVAGSGFMEIWVSGSDFRV